MVTCRKCSKKFEAERHFYEFGSDWSLEQNHDLAFHCVCGQRLILKRGDSLVYAPGVFSSAGSTVFNAITQDKMPKFSRAVVEIADLLRSADPDIGRASNLLRGEPVLAANVLDYANVRKMASGGKVTGIEHAISYMGPSSAAHLLTMGSLNLLTLETKIYKKTAYWHDAVRTALIAEQLNKEFGELQQGDVAYLAGALCNVGKLALALVIPAEVDKIYYEINQLKHLGTWCQGERKLNLPSHEVAGDIAASLWEFKQTIPFSVFYHHTKERIKKSGSRMNVTEIAALANQVAHWENNEPHRVDAEIMQHILGAHAISQADFDAFVTKNIEAWRKVLSLRPS